jgi:uroporphyrinogen-III synthase
MKTTLYLGTNPATFESQGYARGHLIHYPVIKIVPRSLEHLDLKQAYAELSEFTHLIFTSKNAVKIFFQHLADLKQSAEALQKKTMIAIGTVTAAHLAIQGLVPQLVAKEETQEGVIQLLNSMPLEQAYIFMPRSALSRPVLANFFKERNIRFQACDLYDTVTQILEPKPDLDQVDEIVFTSPSTVNAFLEIFGILPKNKRLIAIGPVTEEALKTIFPF